VKYIYLDDLYEWGACGDAIEEFTKLFGKRAPINMRSFFKLWKSSHLDLGWLEETLISGEEGETIRGWYDDNFRHLPTNKLGRYLRARKIGKLYIKALRNS